jgi:hypothetical protein
MNATTLEIEPRRRRATLWFVSFLIMAVALLYQRETGPTRPEKGSYDVAGKTWDYRLLRSEWSHLDARVVLPGPPTGVNASLNWRRYPTEEAFTQVPFVYSAEQEYRGGKGAYIAEMPQQPAAGKLEYFLQVQAEGGTELHIPHDPKAEPGVIDKDKEFIIIRFKDSVPTYILGPHIFMMFLSMWFGMRAALGSFFAPQGIRRLAWLTLLFLTIGGMMLGPLVQKYAFGHYWTGYPNGKDLTDNKMLIMWLSWVFACGVLGTKPKPNEKASRIAVVLAAVVMTVVYCIPHSMRGSELDYSKVDQGIDPGSAVGTSDK